MASTIGRNLMRDNELAAMQAVTAVLTAVPLIGGLAGIVGGPALVAGDRARWPQVGQRVPVLERGLVFRSAADLVNAADGSVSARGVADLRRWDRFRRARAVAFMAPAVATTAHDGCRRRSRTCRCPRSADLAHPTRSSASTRRFESWMTDLHTGAHGTSETRHWARRAAYRGNAADQRARPARADHA